MGNSVCLLQQSTFSLCTEGSTTMTTTTNARVGSGWWRIICIESNRIRDPTLFPLNQCNSGTLPALDKAVIRTTGSITMLTLKKYIIKKLKLANITPSQVSLRLSVARDDFCLKKFKQFFTDQHQVRRHVAWRRTHGTLHPQNNRFRPRSARVFLCIEQKLI